MPEQRMAGLLAFDSRHELCYHLFGRTADERHLPKPVGVHLILPIRGPKDGANLKLRFFVELYSDPAGMHHLIDIAAETISRLIKLFADVGERQVTGIHLGDCAASLVSARHYLEYAAPSLESLIGRYGPACLHSCGPSTHLLPAFGRIGGIEEFHLGWDTDLADARARLGERLIAYLLPPDSCCRSSLRSGSRCGLLSTPTMIGH